MMEAEVPNKSAQPEEKSLNLPKRNLYVTYKAFPSCEKLATPIAW